MAWPMLDTQSFYSNGDASNRAACATKTTCKHFLLDFVCLLIMIVVLYHLLFSIRAAPLRLVISCITAESRSLRHSFSMTSSSLYRHHCHRVVLALSVAWIGLDVAHASLYLVPILRSLILFTFLFHLYLVFVHMYNTYILV